MKARTKNNSNDILAIVLICVLGALVTFQVYQVFRQKTNVSKSVKSPENGRFGGLRVGFNDWKIDSFPFQNLTNIPNMLKEMTLFQTNSNLSENSYDETSITDAKYINIPRVEIKHTKCPFDFKVYVYNLPFDLPAVQVGREARRNKTYHICHKCIFEQFSLEYILNDYLTQFCGRTYNPDEADFFYLPLLRDAEYRLHLDKGIRNRAPSSAEMALIRMMENNDSSVWTDVFKITDKYWRRHNGGDHIIIMPAPVTNLRHESSKRGFFHYMSHLFPPIFVAVEYSLSFVSEYPICSSQKNIIVPYPTIDQEFYSGKLHIGSVDRSALLYYAGGLHGDCIEIRRAMHRLVQNCSKIQGILPDVRTNQAERENGFRAAKYCPVPIGDSPSSKRMYDVINFGCVPVVLSDDLVWAYSDQTNGPFYHKSFSLQLPQVIVQFSTSKLLQYFNQTREALGSLPASGYKVYDLLEDAFRHAPEYEYGIYVNPLVHILRRIPVIDYLYLKHGGEKVAPYFQFYSMNASLHDIPPSFYAYPDGKAMDVFADALSRRKAYGINNIYLSCLFEKNRKDHTYVARYPCVYDIRRRLTDGEQESHTCTRVKLFDRDY